MNTQALSDLEKGLVLHKVRYGPIKARLLKEKDTTHLQRKKAKTIPSNNSKNTDTELKDKTGTAVLEVVITEGKNREVRKIMGYLGLKVCFLEFMG